LKGAAFSKKLFEIFKNIILDSKKNEMCFLGYPSKENIFENLLA